MPRPYVGREGVSDAYLSEIFVECSGEISVAPQSIRHTLWVTRQCQESIYYPNSAISWFNQWEISDGDKVFQVWWFVFLLPLLSVSDGEQEEGKHVSNTHQSQPSNTAHICLQSTSRFDASSRRYCATCCTDVKIAFGGEGMCMQLQSLYFHNSCIHHQFHLVCRGILEKPTGGWFCDSICRESAGFRVVKQHKHDM